MKFLVLVMVAIGLSGCGLQNQINDLKDRSDRNEGDIADLKNRVAALEASMASAQSQLTIIDGSISAQGANLQGQISAIASAVTQLTQSGSASQSQIASLTAALNQAVADAAVLKGRVTATEGDTALLQVSVSGLQGSLADLTALVDVYAHAAYNQFELQGQAIHNLEAGVTQMHATLSGVQYNVGALQSQVNSALVQIATLQGYKNIVALKDPCGKQGSFDEVFLKLSTGEYLSSFSENASGKNTRFSVLTAGTFVTTDGTNCQFTVSADGKTISNEHN